MRVFLEWFNSLGPRDRITVALLPFLGIVLLYMFYISPLLQEKENLKSRLREYRDTFGLVNRIKLLRKEKQKLEQYDTIGDFSLPLFYELAEKSKVKVLTLRREGAIFYNLKLTGKRIGFYSERKNRSENERGKRSKSNQEMRIKTGIFFVEILGEWGNIVELLENLNKKTNFLIVGLYSGCLEERYEMPLICSVEERVYTEGLCKKSKYLPLFKIRFIIPSIGG